MHKPNTKHIHPQSCVWLMTIHTASKAIRCQSMRKKVPCPRQFLWWIIVNMDLRLKTLLLGPWTFSPAYLEAKALQEKQYLSLESIKVPFINIPLLFQEDACYRNPRTKEGNGRHQQFTAPPTADIWHPMAIFLEKKTIKGSKGSTPAIGISAVPARHKSESPWGNHGGLRRLHLLTLTWIMIPWAKWTLTLWVFCAMEVEWKYKMKPGASRSSRSQQCTATC